MDWGMLGVMVGLFAIQTTILMCKLERIHANIQSMIKESALIRLENHDKWIVMNTRIDQTQSIIMKMLEKQGK